MYFMHFSHDIVKRRCKIQGQEVVSKPDLVFEMDTSPFELAHKLQDFSGASSLCVAEVMYLWFYVLLKISSLKELKWFPLVTSCSLSSLKGPV